jgi:ribose transport system permease protein
MNSTAVRSFFQRFGLLISFLLLCLALHFLSDRFMTFGNWQNILRQSSINLIIAIGMTYVILTAGIDLSVGAVLALATVVTADLLQRGFPVIPTILVGLVIGGVLGLVSGLLISRIKVPPFVATLGMMTVARGLALTYTEGRPITGLPDFFRAIGTGSFAGIPMPIIVAGVTFLVAYILLTRTRMGLNIYALGNNPVAAHYAGIATGGYTTFVYVLAGGLAALAGMILVARLDSAQPVAGLGYEFDAIAAVVVGGTSFAGGQGSLFGTLLGVLVIGVLNNGLNLMNISSFWQPVVTGVVIALALLLYKVVR